MKFKQTLLTLAALSCFASFSSAATTFVFENNTTTIGAGLHSQSTGAFTVDGIEITATASVDTFNVTGSGFGINQSASGDDTDGFDFTQSGGPGVAEGFTLKFDQDVNLLNFDVSSFGASDVVTLLDGVTTVATITSTGTTSLSNYFLSSSSTLTVSTTAGTYGNGWSFDSITVVPEPGTSAMLAGILALGFVMVKRRRS